MKTDRKKEGCIQGQFPSTMNNCFLKLKFYDTHKLDFIAYPRKPDVTVTPRLLHPHTETALAIVELKNTKVSIDGTTKGELISAVQRIYELQNTKREIWGFAMNGGSDNNFIYCLHADGECFPFFMQQICFDFLFSF